MSDPLEFGNGSWEEAKGTILSTLRGLYTDMNGNGRDGLKTNVETMRADLIEIKAYGKASAVWLKVLAWIVGISIALASLYVAYFETHHRISETPTQTSGKMSTELPRSYVPQ